MRRYLAALTALVLLLAACAPRQTGEEPETSLTVVGISQVGSESGFRVANSESMRAVFTEEAGYHLLFEDARQKQENQISAIRRFIQQQVDYIVLMPIQETGWDSVLQEARDAGIPVILVDRMVSVKDGSLYASHVGSDFRWEGEQAVAWLEETFREAPGPVNILHIRGTLDTSAQLGRSNALEEAVAQHESWSFLAQLDGDFTQAKTYEATPPWGPFRPWRSGATSAARRASGLSPSTPPGRGWTTAWREKYPWRWSATPWWGPRWSRLSRFWNGETCPTSTTTPGSASLPRRI